VPLVLSVSARLPASIHTPTVDVCAHGECSVAIYPQSAAVQHQIFPDCNPTVKPLASVVLSVLTLLSTGVANPRLIGRTELSAVRLRSAWLRLRANRLEAMAVKGKERASSDALQLPEV